MRMLIASSLAIAMTLAAAPAAVAQAPRDDQAAQTRFCVMVGTEGQARCAWRSLAQCEHARPHAGRCFDRTYMIAAVQPAETAAPAAPARHGVKHRRHRASY